MHRPSFGSGSRAALILAAGLAAAGSFFDRTIRPPSIETPGAFGTGPRRGKRTGIYRGKLAKACGGKVRGW